MVSTSMFCSSLAGAMTSAPECTRAKHPDEALFTSSFYSVLFVFDSFFSLSSTSFVPAIFSAATVWCSFSRFFVTISSSNILTVRWFPECVSKLESCHLFLART